MSGPRSLSVRPTLPLLALALSLSPAAGGRAAAQQDCDFLPGTTSVQGRGAVTYAVTPRIRCRDGVRVSADSATVYEASGVYHLFGRVSFENADNRLNADQAQYYRQGGRLAAQGAVRLLRKSDSTLVTGENLEYLPAGEFRDEEQLTVTGGRPHAVLYPRDSRRAPADTVAEPVREPYEIDADRIFVRGENAFQAYGGVEITRGELDASGDEVDYNGAGGQLVLRREARLQQASYDLEGELILVQMPDDEVREIVSRERAVLRGEDLRVRAPVVHIFLAEGAMERLVAHRGRAAGGVSVAAPDRRELDDSPRGVAEAVADRARAAEIEAENPTRPVAEAPDFTIVADSLEVLAPGEVLETVHAVGRAHAESTARDSLNAGDTPDIARRDWIDGDTVVATFGPVAPPADTLAPPGDTLESPTEGRFVGPGREELRREYRLERLVAKLNARTLYRMAASDSAGTAEQGPGPDAPADAPAAAPADVPEGAAAAPEGPRLPAVHYVVGDSITIVLREGEVESMEVVGQVRGYHLEPASGARGGRTGGGPTGPARREDGP